MEDEQIALRDKIAMSLLDGYLNDNSHRDDEKIRLALLYPKDHADTFSRIENRIRAAYKMADLIRKIRLESFS